MRLSSFLAKKYSISRRYAKKLITSGHVKCGESIIKSDLSININDTDSYIADIKKTEIKYQLEDYLIQRQQGVIFLYKPCNMHTERHTPEDPLCLSDIVKKEFDEYKLISRLDFAVDGAIAAIHSSTEVSYLNKRYLAFVHNIFPSKIEGYWGVDAHKRKSVAVIDDVDEFMTFTPLWSNTDKNITLIQVGIENAGRHQVRAVCAHLGYPILGDILYGDKDDINSFDHIENMDDRVYSTNIDRIALHCTFVQVNDYICNGLDNAAQGDRTLLHAMTQKFMDTYKS